MQIHNPIHIMYKENRHTGEYRPVLTTAVRIGDTSSFGTEIVFARAGFLNNFLRKHADYLAVRRICVNTHILTRAKIQFIS